MRLLITLLLTTLICACGQKGPLFLPTDTDEKTVTTSNPAPQGLSQKESLEPETAVDSEAPNKAQFEAQLKSKQSPLNP